MKFDQAKKYKNPVEVFDYDKIKKINETSCRILREIGMKIYDEKTLQFLSDSGLDVDFEKNIVRFEKDLLDSCLKKVPKTFSYFSQDGEEMKVGSGEFYTVSMVEENYFLDPGTGKRRESTKKDLIDCIRLLDELPNYHICCNPVLPHDIEPVMAIVYSAAQIYKNSDKNCLVVPSTGQEAKLLIEMASAVAGSEKNLIEKPLLSVSIAPSSPLKLPKNICEVIWEYSSRGLPIIVVQAPMAGASSPVTIAGTMAQANAESLATIALVQLIKEHTPVVYGGAVMQFDLKTAFPAYGSIEWGVMSILTAQMGRYHGIPTYGSAGATSANINDAQSGYEKMSSTLLCYMAGHDLMCDAGLNANGLISFDAIITQNEIFGKVFHISNDIEVNENTLAFDAIKNVFYGSDFLFERHTLDNIKTDFRYSQIANRKSYEGWSEEGAFDAIAKGNLIAKGILKEKPFKKIEDNVEKRIDSILDKARNILSK